MRALKTKKKKNGSGGSRERKKRTKELSLSLSSLLSFSHLSSSSIFLPISTHLVSHLACFVSQSSTRFTPAWLLQETL